MMKAIVGFGLTTLIVQATALFAAGGDDQLFRDKVAPILERRCIHCHGDTYTQGKSLADNVRGRLEGRRRRPGSRAGQAR